MEYTYIGALALAAAAYIYGKKEREDHAQFTEIKSVLAQLASKQQNGARSPSTKGRAGKHQTFSYDQQEEDSDEEEEPQPKKGALKRVLSNSNGLGLKRTGSPTPVLRGLSRNMSQDELGALGGDIEELRSSLNRLTRRNQLLAKQLALNETSHVVEVDSKYTTGHLTPAELETIRTIFSLFDQRHNGTIRTQDLQALHQKLGEPLTDEEAEDVIAELDPSEQGEVTFNRFAYWWYDSHKAGKRSSQYTNRFKLTNAKLSDSSFSVDKVVVQDEGTPFTLEYRLNFYYKQGNGELKQISPWHDVPLYRVNHGKEGQLFNMICEIPKWTRAKFEVATGEPFNPIKQDTKNGQLRYYKHGDMMFNYGCFPQTWEDPNVKPEDTGYPGDNDPIDVLEIGNRQLKTGSITAVKILGVLALIDDGETDWKVIAINIADPMASLMNDVDDVETHIPGAIRAIREYLRDYKNYAGGCLNKYALNDRAMPKDYAIKVVEETHHFWRKLHADQAKVAPAERNSKVWVARSRTNSMVGSPQNKGSGIAVHEPVLDGKVPSNTATGPKLNDISNNDGSSAHKASVLQRLNDPQGNKDPLVVSEGNPAAAGQPMQNVANAD